MTKAKTIQCGSALQAFEVLFAWDPATRRITSQRTDLKPELQDTHQLEAKDGVLWSFGFKDLACFDGRNWTRIDHPDNPPIR